MWAAFLLRSYLEGCRSTVRTNNDPSKWILNLTDSTAKQARWWLRLSKFDSYLVHCTRAKRQAADALLLLKTSGTDQNLNDDDIYHYWAWTATTHRQLGKKKGSVSYMLDNKVTSNNDRVGLSELYAMVTSNEPEHNEWQMTTQDNIHKNEKLSNCRQASITVGLAGSTYNLTGIDSSHVSCTLMGQLERLYLCNYKYAWPFFPIIQVWQDIPVEHVSMSERKENTTGLLWRLMCIGLREVDLKAPIIGESINTGAP